ncbi:tetratricopeptide repeat protein [Nocardia brasiliensis]|uniref:tetratricopeptide repeat protein n=1 Tax=Nocardia brasiliensis TaxID=37326 RepID=UPI0033D24573
MTEFEPYEPGSMNDRGVRLQNEGDHAGAERWYRRSAAMGHVNAMFNLGALLHETDPAEAEQWYRRAATKGDADSMHNLAVLLRERGGNSSEADYWSRAAAEHTTEHATTTEPSDTGESNRGRRVLRQAGYAATALVGIAALLAILGGIIGVIVGSVEWAQADDPPVSDVPLCDDKPMDPDDLCITFQGGKATRETYEDKLAALHRHEDNGPGPVIVSGVLIVGGLATVMACRFLLPILDVDAKPTAPESLPPAQPPRMPAQPARPQAPPSPVPPPSAADDYRALLTLVMGSTGTAERLIEHERSRTPGADRTTLIRKAIDRLTWERERHN